MSDEESREEKDKRIEQIMHSMRLKNQMYLQRHQEVEKDRIEAEKQGSAITKTLPKADKQGKKSSYVEPQTRHEREWDRGKTTEGDWSNFRSQGTYRRASRASDSNWRKPDDAKRKYGVRSNFDSNKKSQNEAKSRGFQESRQFGSTFQKPRGWTKRSEFQKYSENWRYEQRRNFKAELLRAVLKEPEPKPEDSDRVWRDEDDNDEARNKQTRVVKWLDTLKDVEEWETENPSNIYQESLQDKSQCSWDDHTTKEETHLSKNTVKYERKATASGSTDVKSQNMPHKFQSHHDDYSTNVKGSEYCNKAKSDRMLRVKKNTASMDLSIPGIKQHTYQGRSDLKFSSEENISEKQTEPEDRKNYIDQEDKNNRQEKSGFSEEKNDNQKNISIMKTSGKGTDQRPNYPKGRGRGRGFSSNWNVAKLQKNAEHKQVGVRPARGKKADNRHNINQGKLPARSNNYKTTHHPKKTDEARESEGIWSDLDTDETRLEYEKFVKERQQFQTKKYDKAEKVFQEKSDEICSNQEAEAQRAGANENIYKGDSATKEQGYLFENSENKYVQFESEPLDSPKLTKVSTCDTDSIDKHKLQSDVSDVNTYAMFSSQLDKKKTDHSYYKDMTEERDLITKFKTALGTQFTSTPTSYYEDENALKQSSQVSKKETCDVVESTQNIGETSESTFVTAESEFPTTIYFDTCSDENNKVQRSVSKMSSLTVSDENTTDIVKDTKTFLSQPFKSPEISSPSVMSKTYVVEKPKIPGQCRKDTTFIVKKPKVFLSQHEMLSPGKINKTYVVEKPKITHDCIEEENKELSPEDKTSPKKLFSAFKSSSKDYKDEDNNDK